MAYETRLLRGEAVAERTMAFRFERPAGFTFRAGQHARLTLPELQGFDSFGPSRTLSIASAPHEPELLFATRMRDTAFKRTLQAAAPGIRARLDGPDGEMTLTAGGARPAVLIAGGIGVTPFLSMARYAAHARLPRRLWLFYANRRPEDAPFLAELRELERVNPVYRCVPTMTQPEKSGARWDGETGKIDKAMLARHLQGERPGAGSLDYYLAGPPAMVIGMRQVLAELGVPDDNVRDEEFYGY